ncbi:hypothetical protein KGO95_01920 [Patescibacteria group bacterium]|nr:hypothetical protein [Patescibacteria group bacterium]
MNERETGTIDSVLLQKKLIGTIKLDKDGEKIPFLQDDVAGYAGQNIYQFGLVEGSKVSFYRGPMSGMPVNIMIEERPSLRKLAWRTSGTNLLISAVCLSIFVCGLIQRDPDAAFAMVCYGAIGVFALLYAIKEAREVYK